MRINAYAKECCGLPELERLAISSYGLRVERRRSNLIEFDLCLSSIQ